MNILLDTSYLLPLIRVGIKGFERKDLIRLLVKYQISISSISIFELIAKGAKFVANGVLDLEDVMGGIIAILSDKRIRVIDYVSNRDIIEISIFLRKLMDDFIDCIIVATALAETNILLTEDNNIHQLQNSKEFLKIRETVNDSLQILNLRQFKATFKI